MANFTLARRALTPLLEDLARSRSRLGEFDYAVLVPDVLDALRDLIEEDGIDVLAEVAQTITQDFFRTHAPKVSDNGQLSLYDPDAYLTLGERERIRMADATALHVERWRRVETTNFQGQSSAYFTKMAYIDERLPQLRETGGTLDEIERALGEELA